MTLRALHMQKHRTHPARTVLCLAALTVILSGCAGVSALPLVGKGETKIDRSAATASAPAPAPISPPAHVAPRLLPGDFTGLDAANTDALLGQQPAAIIREGAGEIRRYANQQCNLLVILYPDGRGQRSVQTIESTSFYSGAAKPDLQTCLNGF